MVVALCVSCVFVQGSHVRVDLVYANVSNRTKRAIDMFGSLVFMLPEAAMTRMYAWYFFWRHSITPKVSASDKLELMLKKARIVKWNVEATSNTGDGFSVYLLFKILMLSFVVLVFI